MLNFRGEFQGTVKWMVTVHAHQVPFAEARRRQKIWAILKPAALSYILNIDRHWGSPWFHYAKISPWVDEGGFFFAEMFDLLIREDIYSLKLCNLFDADKGSNGIGTRIADSPGLRPPLL